LTSTLPLMGVLAQPGIGSPALFEGLAQRALQDADGAIFTATRVEDGGFEVVVGVGDGPGPGRSLTGYRLALVERALAVDGLVSDLADEGEQRRLAFASVVDADAGIVVFQEFVFEGEALIDTGPDSPFSDLAGALYVSDREDPSRLLLATTSELPIEGGQVVRGTVDVGDDEWLLVAKPRRSLVGGFTSNAAWLVLGVGLGVAVLVSALVGVLSRRRSYAVALVDERTRELRDALAEQERLDEGQRLAREAAEEANRSKSEFLSRMSHELRTPLNAVLGFAQLLELEDLRPTDRDAVEQILKGGRHLLDLINEVLDITRIESGSLQLSPEPVLVSEVLSDVVDLTGSLAAAANIHLVHSPASGARDVHVLADRQRLKQVLLNLVANAIKYNRPGGSVALSCEHVEPAGLRLLVRDTGPGIRPEHLGLLFMPFERLGAEHTTVEGTGIGLALSRRLAEAMGGTLEVDSTVGQGSTFWVQLPVVEGPVERYVRFNGSTEAAGDPATSGPAKAKILYIEDNLANLRLVERILAVYPDVELITAMQGRLGFDLAREHRPALVLLDLHLPDVGGDVVLRQLRDDPLTGSIPVAMVSADATPGEIKRLLGEGALAYLTKPIDVQELRSLVGSVLVPVP